VNVAAPTRFPELLLFEPRVHADERGTFVELYNPARYRDAGLTATFVQDNLSVSHRHVLRGMHLQHPHGQGKLITILRGEVFDVAVDVRVGSPTFGQWAGVTLSAARGHQLWIPPGFAHGFVVTGDAATMLYKVTAPYVPDAECTIRWDDPAIGIAWPVVSPILAARDADAAPLATVDRARLPRWEPPRT
jgi:dTDP-4-dehydrorhamnose 3,5-epimerase